MLSFFCVILTYEKTEPAAVSNRGLIGFWLSDFWPFIMGRFRYQYL